MQPVRYREDKPLGPISNINYEAFVEDDDNDAAAAADTPSDACAETSDPAADIAATADGETRE